MDKLKQEMILRARRKFKNIYPCGQKKKFSECFTTDKDEISFWFNTEDNSTRLIVARLEN
ncbi:MAG: hypothetical protein ACLFVQ_13485 [Chitinispirillaceae bacterium]